MTQPSRVRVEKRGSRHHHPIDALEGRTSTKCRALLRLLTRQQCNRTVVGPHGPATGGRRWTMVITEFRMDGGRGGDRGLSSISHPLKVRKAAY